MKKICLAIFVVLLSFLAWQKSKTTLYFLGSKISPNGNYRIDGYRADYRDKNNYYQLFLTDIKNGQVKKIYNGDYHSSGWEWTQDNRIQLKYDCGTCCVAAKIISPSEMSASSDKSWQIITRETTSFQCYTTDLL